MFKEINQFLDQKNYIQPPRYNFYRVLMAISIAASAPIGETTTAAAPTVEANNAYMAQGSMDWTNSHSDIVVLPQSYDSVKAGIIATPYPTPDLNNWILPRTPTPTLEPTQIPTSKPSIQATITRSSNNKVCSSATYYHPSLHGDLMRSEIPYNRFNPQIAAFNLAKIGTEITVTTQTLPPRSATYKVLDTGHLGNNVDLSEAGFQLLAPLSAGRIPVCISW